MSLDFASFLVNKYFQRAWLEKTITLLYNKYEWNFFKVKMIDKSSSSP